MSYEECVCGMMMVMVVMMMQKNSNSTFCDKYINNNNNNNNNTSCGAIQGKKNVRVHDRILTDVMKIQLFPSE